jgi:hypothetical protein
VSPTVRIDDEVYEKLKGHAEPFVDTPNTVLRRLLGLDPVEDLGARWSEPETEEAPVQIPRSTQIKPSARTAQAAKARRPKKAVARTKARRTRVPSGALLPEDRYRVPLLSALVQLGGSAPYKEVVDRVGELLTDDLTDMDREPLNSGGIRWQSRLQFVRLHLIEQGLMVRESGRGVWAISEEGRKYVEQHESGVA